MSFKGFMDDYGMNASDSDEGDEGDEGSEQGEEDATEKAKGTAKEAGGSDDDDEEEGKDKEDKEAGGNKFDFESLLKFGYKPPKEKEKKKNKPKALDPGVAMIKGNVKWWNTGKGFGFITQKDDPDADDLFCHISEFQLPGNELPEEGGHVLFQIHTKTEDGVTKTSAVHVRYDDEAYKADEEAYAKKEAERAAAEAAGIPYVDETEEKEEEKQKEEEKKEKPKRVIGMQTKEQAILQLKKEEEEIAAKKAAKKRVSIYIAQKPTKNKRKKR